MADATVSLDSVVKHFDSLPDPRDTRNRRHLLVDVIVISVCGVIVGCEGPTAIVRWAKAKKDWLGQVLELPNGIPSKDCVRRVLSLLKPAAFQECFQRWIGECLLGNADGSHRTIAIDGKTMRRSHNHAAGLGPLHMVSAFASEHGIALGQIATEEKSNEITAIPKLLKALALEGCIVTIDAMGCQKAIAEQIIEQDGDYLLALKGNQERLSEAVEALFDKADTVGYEGYLVDYYETEERSRDRTETRRYWTMECDDGLEHTKLWKGLNIIGMVESERSIQGQTSIECRYYIGSIENNAVLFGQSVRHHWGIENGLHWQLDMGFREDESRLRKGYSAENFAVMRHVAINLLKQDRTTKLGVKNKRLKAGWDDNYLIKLLSNA